MLSSKQLKDVCLAEIHDHRQCRYLAQDEMDWSKWYCCKKVEAKKRKIDAAIDKYLRECKKNGSDPYSNGVPLGDNCAGYPIFRHIQQGCDQDD
jgi:hypothetical protein